MNNERAAMPKRHRGRSQGHPYESTFQDLVNECIGRWDEIVRALSHADVGEALAKKGKHVHCHIGHSNRKKFRLFDDFDTTGGAICSCGSWSDGFALMNHLNGWDRKTATREIANYLRDTSYNPVAHTQCKETTRRSFVLDDSHVQKLNELWASSQPLEGTLGEQYLRDRGITADLPDTGDIRFVPALNYWDNETDRSLGAFPAIVSLMRSPEKGNPLTIHRIYLDPVSGKARVPMPKKLMSTAIDGAIGQLGAVIMPYKPSGDCVAITEGLETAFAVRSAFPDLTVWSAFSANVLAHFKPPKGVRKVFIFGDVDKSGTGQVYAARLSLTLKNSGINSQVLLPSNDVSLPEEDNKFTPFATRERVTERLQQEGYRIQSDCDDIDWLDAWVNNPDSLRSIL